MLSLSMPTIVFRFALLRKSGGQSGLSEVIPSGLLQVR